MARIIEAQTRAMQALVELLKLLELQYGYNVIEYQGGFGNGRYYRTYKFFSSDYLSEVTSWPACPEISIHMYKIERKYWQAISAEVGCSNDGDYWPRLFRFKWSAKNGSITGITEESVLSYMEYVEWTRTVYQFCVTEASG